jgi:hypothetical protein
VKSRWPTTALVLLATLLLAPAASAELLEGRIFLGPGLSLYLEKEEGLFTEMLRALNLVDGEIPVVDLAGLEISREHLFLGTDNGLYLRDEERELHRVGSWERPGAVTLDPGVELHTRRTVAEIFQGEVRESLAVTLSSEDRPAEGPVEEAGLAFWLERLASEYIPGSMTRGEEEDVGLVMNAVLGAMPTTARPTAAQAESLKKIDAWLEANPYDSSDAIRLLVEQALVRLNASEVHDDEVDGQEQATLQALREHYRQLGERLEARAND